MIFNTLLFTAAGFAGFYWQSWLPVIVVAPIAAFIWVYRLHRQPLIWLSAEQASEARSREGAGLLSGVLAIWLQ